MKNNNFKKSNIQIMLNNENFYKNVKLILNDGKFDKKGDYIINNDSFIGGIEAYILAKELNLPIDSYILILHSEGHYISIKREQDIIDLEIFNNKNECINIDSPISLVINNEVDEYLDNDNPSEAGVI